VRLGAIEKGPAILQGMAGRSSSLVYALMLSVLNWWFSGLGMSSNVKRETHLSYDVNIQVFDVIPCISRATANLLRILCKPDSRDWYLKVGKVVPKIANYCRATRSASGRGILGQDVPLAPKSERQGIRESGKTLPVRGSAREAMIEACVDHEIPLYGVRRRP
jgi:hypothetical protein